MAAITTQYFGPTASRGSRIKVTMYGQRSFYVPVDPALDDVGNHDTAADRMAANANPGIWKGSFTHRLGERVYVRFGNASRATIR